MADVFLSYARSDLVAAQKLAAAIESFGWSVWWDTKLRAGEIFDDIVSQELSTAPCVVVLWSKTAVKSDFVRDEARRAKRRGVLVPVTIDDAEPPLGFGELHTRSLSGWYADDARDCILHLRSDIERLAERPGPRLRVLARG